MNNGWEADPEGIQSLARQIKETYSSYISEKTQMFNTISDVAAAWSGADAAGYVTQANSYEPDFKKLGEIIDQISTILNDHGVRLAEARDSIKAAASKL
jgi:WXG100 family type VII secretion target